MTRKLELAGVLVAVIAIFALATVSAQATFTSAGYGWTGNGSSATWTWDFFNSTVTCTASTFDLEKHNSGEPIDGPTQTVTVTSHHTKCHDLSGLPVTVNYTGCDRVFHSPPLSTDLTADLVCPVGVKGVDITIYSSSAHSSALCHMVITPYAGKGGFQAHNNGSHIVVTGSIGVVVVLQERTNFLCPAGTETKEGKETIQAGGITFSGSNGAISIS